MSSLIVVSFESPDEAAAVLESLRGQAKFGNISLDDTAVVSKDPDGHVHVKNNVSHGTMTATGIGALLGLLLGTILFPIGGLLLGAGGGALVGRFMNLGVDGDFVKQVSETLQPGTSALFILARDADPAVVRAVFESHKGTVIDTTLTSEQEESLKRALS